MVTPKPPADLTINANTIQRRYEHLLVLVRKINPSTCLAKFNKHIARVQVGGRGPNHGVSAAHPGKTVKIDVTYARYICYSITGRAILSSVRLGAAKRRHKQPLLAHQEGPVTAASPRRPPASVPADALGPARVREELWACGYGEEGLFWRGGE
jgi:hypothetical protein